MKYTSSWMQNLSALITCLCLSVQADIVLRADNCDDHDACWIKRYDSGKNTWGIRGTGESLQGWMWFNGFPGGTGEYRVRIGIVADADGRSEYALEAGGRELKKGKFPCPSLDCDCSKKTAADVIDIGTHAINKGEKIRFWGKSVYPCGSHGSYSRWYEIRFEPLNADTFPQTEIVFPPEEAQLQEGREYALTGEGTNLHWSYDANSDDLGKVAVGDGSPVSFVIPENVTDPRNITFFLDGANGSAQRTVSIIERKDPITLLAPTGGETFYTGETIGVEWEADTDIITDVVIRLSTDLGLNWSILNTNGSISVSDSNWGRFAWSIPDTTDSSSACLLSVEKYDTSNPEEIDMTATTFTIQGNTALQQGRHADKSMRIPRILHTEKGIIIRGTDSRPVTAALTDLRGREYAARRGSGHVTLPLVRYGSGVYLLRVVRDSHASSVHRIIVDNRSSLFK